MRNSAYVKLFGRRKNTVFLLALTIWCMLMWCCSSWLSMLPKYTRLPSEEGNLQHFRRNRNLTNYMNNVHLLVEPITIACPKHIKVPVIVLVASSPQSIEQRQAVRATWGSYQPTYFLLGLSKNDMQKQLEENKLEAKKYNDMVVFDFLDHFQNLTLKSALMIYWTIGRCSHADFMLKTDDDVLINPTALSNVLKDKHDAKLIGHRINDMLVHRAPFIRWYVPYWLYALDVVPQQLCGAGYFINGKYLPKILHKAYEVPLVNLEDMYFTYLVAYKGLGYHLRHDRTISPKKPWIKNACAYQSWTITHGYNPDEMRAAWKNIQSVGLGYKPCWFYSTFLESDFFMFYNYHLN